MDKYLSLLSHQMEIFHRGGSQNYDFLSRWFWKLNFSVEVVPKIVIFSRGGSQNGDFHRGGSKNLKFHRGDVDFARPGGV